MGRFVHEAVAVDPRDGVVYETEDARRAGMYRFARRCPERLAEGGRLQMLAVRGTSAARPPRRPDGRRTLRRVLGATSRTRGARTTT